VPRNVYCIKMILLNPIPHGYGTKRAFFLWSKIGTGCLKEKYFSSMPHEISLKSFYLPDFNNILIFKLIL
jgi:hypothetical protein